VGTVNPALQVDPERVAAYIRWSTDEQTDGTTLDVQLEACRHFILSQGWRFRDELLFIDEGYSGGTLDRPGLGKLRRAVQEGRVNCVVVYKLDRLSRSVLDTVTLVLKEWDGICCLRSAREPVDTSSPAGTIFFYMLASYAEWERSLIRERTLSGKIKRAQQGRNPGFTAPYGYQRGEEPGRLAVSEAEAAVVRRIFREFLAGRGIHAIAAGLNRDGLRPRRSAGWRADGVARILTNPLVKGELQYGRSTAASSAQRRQGAGARVRFAAPRYAAVSGAVPAIIDPADWERARQVRESREAAGCRARGAHFLLTGIARCRCGATVRGDGRRRSGRYYRCSRTVDAPGPCTAGLILAEQADGAVLEAVGAALEPGAPALLQTVRAEGAAARLHGIREEARRIRESLARLERTRHRLDADYRSGELPARLYAAQAAELEGQEEALRAVAAQADAELGLLNRPGSEGVVRRPDWTDPDRSAIGCPLPCLAPEEQKQLLRHLVAACELYRQAGTGAGPLAVRLCLRRA
jgi:DNA invertase Pin-like site-specific DNA recombinase